MKQPVLAMLLVLFGAGVIPDTHAQQVQSTAIVSLSTGQCWDVQDYSTADQAVIQMFTCAGTPNQQWVFQVYAFNGFGPVARIVNVLSGMCVSAESLTPTDGSIGIRQRICNPNDPLQQWALSAPFTQIAVKGQVVTVPVLTHSITNVGSHWCMRTEDSFFRPILANACSAPGDAHSWYRIGGI